MSNEERIQMLQQQIAALKARMLDYKMQFEESEKQLLAMMGELNGLTPKDPP